MCTLCTINIEVEEWQRKCQRQNKRNFFEKNLLERNLFKKNLFERNLFTKYLFSRNPFARNLFKGISSQFTNLHNFFQKMKRVSLKGISLKYLPKEISPKEVSPKEISAAKEISPKEITPERNLPCYHCHSYMTIFITSKGWMLPCDFYFSSMQISIRYVFKVGQKISLAPLYTHYPHQSMFIIAN